MFGNAISSRTCACRNPHVWPGTLYRKEPRWDAFIFQAELHLSAKSMYKRLSFHIRHWEVVSVNMEFDINERGRAISSNFNRCQRVGVVLFKSIQKDYYCVISVWEPLLLIKLYSQQNLRSNKYLFVRHNTEEWRSNNNSRSTFTNFAASTFKHRWSSCTTDGWGVYTRFNNYWSRDVLCWWLSTGETKRKVFYSRQRGAGQGHNLYCQSNAPLIKASTCFCLEDGWPIDWGLNEYDY